jgi:hypothetical protein
MTTNYSAGAKLAAARTWTHLMVAGLVQLHAGANKRQSLSDYFASSPSKIERHRDKLMDKSRLHCSNLC